MMMMMMMMILYLPFVRFRKFSSILGFPGGSDGKESTCNAGDPVSNPGLGKSPGEWNGNPLQYSCLTGPWTEEPSRLQSMGSQRVGDDWATNTHNSILSFLRKCLFFPNSCRKLLLIIEFCTEISFLLAL